MSSPLKVRKSWRLVKIDISYSLIAFAPTRTVDLFVLA